MASVISVNGNAFDTSNSTTKSKDASGFNYLYIQGKTTLTEDQKQTLMKIGAEITEFVYTATYICKYMSTDLQPIRTLPFIQAVGVFPSEVKATTTLKAIILKSAQQAKLGVHVYLHEELEKTSEEVAEEVSSKVGVAVDEMELSDDGFFVPSVDVAKIESIASIDSVKRIEEYRDATQWNTFARRVIYNPNENFAPNVAPVYQKYQGKGQNVCVADTGIDKDHSAFANTKNITIIDDVKDYAGHGTHVCASIVGNGNSKVGNETFQILGTATQADLTVQVVTKYNRQTSKFEFRPNPNYSIPLGQAKGFSSIHSNSWGRPDLNHIQLGYNRDAEQVDTFTNRYQDFLVVVAAGNDQYDDATQTYRTPQIGGMSIAKNALTVGATIGPRSDLHGNYDPNAPTANALATNLATVANFSNIGPTLPAALGAAPVPGRIKPDVVAPGTAILSARSKDMTPAERAAYLPRGVWGDDKYVFSTGTSMATPLVSGCCAGIREAIANMKPPFQGPSAALIKALVVNGTVDLQGNHNGRVIGPAPNPIQGFGRVDMSASLIALNPSNLNVGFIDAKDPKDVKRGEKRTSGPLVAAGVWTKDEVPYNHAQTFKATLVYPDPPQERTQNNLNLIARIKNAAGAVIGECHGNQAPGSLAFDEVNNVEKIVWPAPPAGTLELSVRVNGITKPGGKQNFAVVWMSV